MKALHGNVGFALAAMLLCGAACFPSIDYLDELGAGGNSATSSSSGTGGMPPACLLGDLGGCGVGMKCSVIDLASGEVGCTQAGNRQWWSRCSLDADCVEGAFCDPARQVCKPFCSSSNDCIFAAGAFEGECLPLTTDTGTAVPGGHNLCVPNCNPKTAAPCDSNDYVNCIFTGNGRFDCIISDDEVEGSNCQFSSECGAGMVCALPPGAGPGACAKWCTPVDAPSIDCQNNGQCVGFNPAIKYNDTPHGSCL